MSDEVQRGLDPISLFPQQSQLAVRGLSFLGFIQHDFDFCGHTFTLRTLRPGEKAAAALAAQQYKDTIAEPDVWSHALVGLALVAIDGRADFCPPAGPSVVEFAKARLNYLTNPDDGWYTPTLSFLYDCLLSLEAEALTAVEELRNLAARSRATLLPSPDSLSALGISDELTSSDSQP